MAEDPRISIARLAPYEDIFQSAAEEWNIDPVLLKALALQESLGHWNLTSPSGAQGLMQIMPGTQRALGVTNPWDPVQAIFGGAKYLSEGLDKEKGPEGALLYYHGGPGWRGSYARSKESQDYVPAIAGWYRRLTPPPPPAATTPTPASPAPTTSPGGDSPDGE